MSLLQLDQVSIPKGCVLGLNYSGMHDTAIALVSPDGIPLYAVALERISRVKMDGRPPNVLLNEMPWDRIAKVAIPTNGEFIKPIEYMSRLHPIPLAKPHTINVLHDPVFYEFVKRIPCEVEFVCHRISHVSSSFWGSEFNEALCLNYDGGMANDPWFGGLYRADRKKGIVPLDQFSAEHYGKITLLYQVVTALLGFTASKHEGKVTGLAAYGKPSERCRSVFNKWLKEDFLELESTLRWVFAYSDSISAHIVPNGSRLKKFCKEVLAYPREDIAATVQDLAETHILEILAKAKALGWTSDNICLSGGLFANVKINQRVSEAGFKHLFVAPPMTDDGTALGAAWDVLSRQTGFNPTPLHSMYLGPSYPPGKTLSAVTERGIRFEASTNPALKIAALLAEGAVVAVFQGAMEFGPRSLGNRSILASAADPDINRVLNERLNRTEFMPFAPIGRMEDADSCYLNIERVRHAAEFMTVTVNCTEKMKKLCPAVVHIDGTARPQLVTAKSNPLIYEVLTEYQSLTGKPVLVNTSFNIHEEPIVCSPDDALRGFFESALDYLYMERIGLISFKGNEDVAIQYLREKIKSPSAKLLALEEMNHLLDAELSLARVGLEEKEAVIQELSTALNAFRQATPHNSYTTA